MKLSDGPSLRYTRGTMAHDVPWHAAWRVLMDAPAPANPRAMDVAAVRRTFRRRVLETHPDIAGPSSAGRFRKITEAYDTLVRHAASVESASASEPPAPGPTTPSIPQRRLAFAQFLFHLGWVSGDVVVEALRWQDEHRIPLGRLAQETKLLTARDVDRILMGKRAGERFGVCAARLGLLPREVVARLVERQRRLQPLVGQFFVQRGLLSDERMRRALRMHREHNDRVDRCTPVTFADIR